MMLVTHVQAAAEDLDVPRRLHRRPGRECLAMAVAANGHRSAAMADTAIARTPPALAAIQADTARLGFSMASDTKTGALLAVLSAAKPGGRLLEIGTGTGIGTAWLLAGMDGSARLDTVDSDPAVVDVARRHLGGDARVAFRVEDGAAFLARAAPDTYDLVYADAWPGKFTELDAALGCLRHGGFYVIDDLLPQANWPAGHAEKVDALIADLERRPGFATVRLAWASGLMLVVRQGASTR
jgi:predicted O-methyltransferase YrrM